MVGCMEQNKMNKKGLIDGYNWRVGLAVVLAIVGIIVWILTLIFPQ